MTAMELPEESLAALEDIERRRAQRAENMREAGAVRRAGVSAVRRAGASIAAPLQAESYAAPGRRADPLVAFGDVVAPRRVTAPVPIVDPLEARVAELERRLELAERIIAELTGREARI
jgi:hypothetical protein